MFIVYYFKFHHQFIISASVYFVKSILTPVILVPEVPHTFLRLLYSLCNKVGLSLMNGGK